MTVGMGAVLAGVFGAIIGSFLNVVVYRLPRGESLSHPRSRCPRCEVPIRPYDNVPVLSWLVLRGRCRNCLTPISPRYPLVETATGVLCALVVIAYGEDAWLGLALVLLLVPITLIDLDHQIIPNRLTLLGAMLAPAILLATDPGSLPEHLIAAAAGGGFFLVALLAYPRGMGMGDVKLAAVLGLFLGRDVAPAIFVALIAGTVAGLVVLRLKGRSTKFPFGPSLAFGALVALFAGDAMVDWYAGTFL